MKLPNYIEIETSRFCNRTCKWCPNDVLMNRRKQELLPWTLFEKIVRELSRYDYSGWLAFHNYNEPLTNARIVTELLHVHKYLPDAQTTIYTNGDLLSESLYASLSRACLSQMRVTLYPKDESEWKASRMRIEAWLERNPYLLERPWTSTNVRQGLAYHSDGKPEILIISPEIDLYYDRGGTIPWLSISERTFPCFLTSNSLSVDYLGNIKMCCNVVTGEPSHERYFLGNVKDLDLIKVWNSDRFEAIRKLHLVANWSTTEICRTCRQKL